MKTWNESLYGGTSWSKNIRNSDLYFQPGLTFGRRIRTLAPSALPPASIFSDSSPTIFLENASSEQLISLLWTLNAPDLQGLFATYVPDRKMEVGYLQRLPIPASAKSGSYVRVLEEYRRRLSDQLANEVSLGFVSTSHGSVCTASAGCEEDHSVYGLSREDREIIESAIYHDAHNIPNIEDDIESNSSEQSRIGAYGSFGPATDLSYTVGCVFGRWDLRLATGEKDTNGPPWPFDPPRVCSPGMLQGPDGLPVREPPDGYPLRIDKDGILVDDPDHPDDIIRRSRDVLELIWKDRAEAIEKEACEILGVAELRDYVRKPAKGGFWDDHVSRYSKSRRKAPIYWLLQSSRKNYALWLYYHRLDKDTLFKALVNYVEPKLRLESGRLQSLVNQKASTGDSGKEAKRLARETEKQEDLLSELRDFEDRLRRAANLHLEPDLNDGVVLNIAPLWEVVPWKEARAYWDELRAGKYEWSSIGQQLRRKGLIA